MLHYSLHPEAQAEAFSATRYIQGDSVHEGRLFVRAIEDALIWARTEPLIFRCFEGEFRKVKVGKFSYSLVFRLRGDQIHILAVMHMSRRPGYWKDRDAR